ncbi:MAG: adenylate/guanylate cyclase domain-containing protein [Proteobacteria bacterium]|nr:adenylate/guanylate cyclase domain-containing protein [Pseudomonadota bacterium]
MPTIHLRAVLFADLRGSTALFDELGNAQATQVVTQTVAALARQVPAAGGVLIKTLGDGLLATFPTAAAATQSARRMQPAAGALQLRIAITLGEVAEVDGDCFGDAVNVAARLVELAGDQECLVTQELLSALPQPEQESARALTPLQLRGRAEPVALHLLALRGPDTSATLMGTVGGITVGTLRALKLRWPGGQLAFTPHQRTLLIGRSPQARLHIDDSRVSRSHARIDMVAGAPQLVDLSINGTFVRFAGDDELLSLRRGGCTLHGSGQIGLGAPPGEGSAPTIYFQVSNTHHG